jgi:hypothetical protein
VGGGNDSMPDIVAKKLAQVYLIVNLIDGLFWFYSMMTLRIHVGDTIHE